MYKKRWMPVCLFLLATLLWACAKEDSGNATDHGKPGSITRFASLGNYLYALDQNRIVVYDITNPAQLQKLNEVVTEYGLETITLYEGTIYIGSRTALYILDISNPAAPVLTGKGERPQQLAGGCDPVTVKDGYAYSTVKVIENVCGGTRAVSLLLTYDLSDKEQPLLVDEEEMNIPNGLGYRQNTLFVCDEGADRIVLFDITTPENPTFLSYFDLTDPVDVIVDGDRMVVSTKTGFSFFDVSDINNIQSRGNIEIQ